jgi:hypothetical protein
MQAVLKGVSSWAKKSSWGLLPFFGLFIETLTSAGRTFSGKELSDLSPGNGSTTVISNPEGTIDNVIFSGGYGNADLISTNCGHNANCTFPQQWHFLLGRSGSPCSTTGTISNPTQIQILYLMDNGWNIFDLMEGEWELESVTHRIY